MLTMGAKKHHGAAYRKYYQNQRDEIDEKRPPRAEDPAAVNIQ